MQGAILIFGGTAKQRDIKISEVVTELFGTGRKLENIPDLKFGQIPDDKKSIGVDEVKEGITFLQEKPLETAGHKVLVFPQAEAILPRAQNILLKTLEEPPAYATIILSAKTRDSIIETVVSRCRLVQLKVDAGDNADEKDAATLTDKLATILTMSFDEKLKWAENLTLSKCWKLGSKRVGKCYTKYRWILIRKLEWRKT
jgi:DNA polymerase III delta prime subunit